MVKAIVRYRDDQDLENVIDFVQKKVEEFVFIYLFKFELHKMFLKEVSLAHRGCIYLFKKHRCIVR